MERKSREVGHETLAASLFFINKHSLFFPPPLKFMLCLSYK